MEEKVDQLKNISFSPNYSLALQLENEYNHQKANRWMQQNWPLSVFLSLAYVFLVFFGQKLMSYRAEPFRLKFFLTVWSFLLAVFSIIGTLRSWPEMIHVIRHFGLYQSICSNSYLTKVPINSFWSWLFTLSKAPELLDTLFIILRKQKLILLHWYHHASVLVFTWYTFADEASTGRWYLTMNYTVHAIMYSYYTVRAYGLRVPRPLAMFITFVQILQMLIGTVVTFAAFYAKTSGNSCDISYSTLYMGIVIYISYFILFAEFFVTNYCGGKGRAGDKKAKSL